MGICVSNVNAYQKAPTTEHVLNNQVNILTLFLPYHPPSSPNTQVCMKGSTEQNGNYGHKDGAWEQAQQCGLPLTKALL